MSVCAWVCVCACAFVFLSWRGFLFYGPYLVGVAATVFLSPLWHYVLTNWHSTQLNWIGNLHSAVSSEGWKVAFYKNFLIGNICFKVCLWIILILLCQLKVSLILRIKLPRNIVSSWQCHQAFSWLVSGSFRDQHTIKVICLFLLF